MRKLFFVKKNVNEPTGASNWIEMNVDEFNEFISTEEGKARKNNFAPLFGFGMNIYIDVTKDLKKEEMQNFANYVRSGNSKEPIINSI